MKHLILVALLLFQTLPAAAQHNTIDADGRLITAPATEKHLQENKIYFFAHSMCINCKDAYIYFDRYHRNLNIPIADMKFSQNFKLYKECVKKFNIQNDELSLPLICMGNHYIMGWEPQDGTRFEEYLKEMPHESSPATSTTE